MAKEKGAKNPQEGNVVSLQAAICPAEKCGKKATRMEFCEEHYVWFKEGLITRAGERPKDFDKKYQAYLLRNKKAA